MTNNTKNIRSKKTAQTRNFGIAAHIDAGKTTTSERILRYTGEIHKIKEVHEGGATMDYMEQERKRGITIQSASTQCEWEYKNPKTGGKEKITLNLIDTPGHIDFTIEVERALRVLDGAIIALEGVAGVQPQTLTVYRQKTKYKLPTLIFINKMDRMGADFEHVLSTIEKKLDRTIVNEDGQFESQYAVLNIPVGVENDFSGVIDIVTMQYYKWEGNETNFSTLPIPDDYVSKADKYRSKLLNLLSGFSDEILNLFFEGKEVSNDLIISVLREQIIKRRIVGILCGAAFKNKGIQPLLDAVAYYFPAPDERGDFTGVSMKDKDTTILRKPSDGEKFSAFVFKIIPLPNLGELSCARIFSGSIKSGDSILNANNGKKDKIGRIYIIKANKYEEVKECSTGDIVAFQGLKDITTGVTLCGGEDGEPIVYDQMSYPTPVISQQIIPSTKQDEAKMSVALSKLTKEDPSFSITTNNETNETLINGMGDLHLQVKTTLLKDDYGINFTLLPPTINYRETPKADCTLESELKKQTGGAGQYANITIEVKKYTDEEKNQHGDEITFKSLLVGTAVDKKFIPSIEEGIKDSCKNAGPIGRYPIINCGFILHTGKQHSVDSNSHAFYQCAITAVREIMKKVGTNLLEPIMQVFIYVPHEYMGSIIGDISSKDGTIVATTTEGNSVKIESLVPLRHLLNDYIGELRSSTKGQGSFDMSFSHYDVVPEHAVGNIQKSREHVHYKS